MTQDYKDILLKYLTGNLNIETGINEPQFQETVETESQIGYYLDNNAGSGYEIIDIIQGYQSTYSMIYGNTTNNTGFIVILDENYNPVQYIDSYSNGTQFSKFQILNVAEDGYIYGIDIKNSTPRFIMLNNITLKTPNQTDFIVRLRQSYNLPSPLSTATSYFAITKAVGQAKYFIGATVSNSGKNNVLGTELTINVGESNEWINYTKTSDYNFTGCSLWASWNEDTIDFRIDGYGVKNNTPSYISYYLYNNSVVEFTGTTTITGSPYEINTVTINKYMTFY